MEGETLGGAFKMEELSLQSTSSIFKIDYLIGHQNCQVSDYRPTVDLFLTRLTSTDRICYFISKNASASESFMVDSDMAEMLHYLVEAWYFLTLSGLTLWNTTLGGGGGRSAHP